MHGALSTMTTIIRNRRGRKRRTTAARKADGRIDHVPVDYREMAGDWPHRRGLPMIQGRDGKPVPGGQTEHAENPFGRLYVLGRITWAQHEAGEKYARIVGRYRAVIEAPTSSPRSIAGTGEPTGAFFHMDDSTAAARKKTYDDAFAALWIEGQKPARTVARVCVNAQPIATHEEMAWLICGLDALAAHFGLTKPGKSRPCNN